MLIEVFSSCNHKDLCYDHYHKYDLRILFNWKEVETVPKVMRVYFYSHDVEVKHPFIFDISSSEEVVSLPEGVYDVCCYNVDTENIISIGEQDFNSFELKTGKYAYRGRGEVSDILVDTPDFLCSDIKRNVTIYGDKEKEQVLELTPFPAVSNYTYEVHGIKNLKNARQIKGFLSGVSSSVHIINNELSLPLYSTSFDVKVEDGVLVGAFNIFGEREDQDGKKENFLKFDFLIDGKNDATVSFNVTEQIYAVSPVRGYVRNVHLVVHTDFELPRAIGNGKGFKLDVEDWETEEIDVDLN